MPYSSFLLDLWFYNGNTESILAFHKSQLNESPVGFSVSFIIHMKIVNTVCISREKIVCHYVDLTVKVFKENSVR